MRLNFKRRPSREEMQDAYDTGRACIVPDYTGMQLVVRKNPRQNGSSSARRTAGSLSGTSLSMSTSTPPLISTRSLLGLMA